jgi:glycosyltransferase involved in cell wall biosynthesis
MTVDKTTTKAHNRIMVFELSVGGHYPEYISHLINYWWKKNLEGQLYLVVSPQFIEQHFDVVKPVEENNSEQTKLISITSEEFGNLKPFNTGINRKIRAWQEFKLIRKYAINLKANHIFFPYFDTRQIPIFLGKRLPCTYSGIYFRPSFHYKHFVRHNALWRDELQRARERFSLSKILNDSQLKTLFCLDPFAIEHINRMNSKRKAVYLPDPVKVYSNSSSNLKQLKCSLEIEYSRKVYLLFGNLGKRKGLDKLLEATALLSAKLCQRLCILLVGSIPENYYQECLDTITQVRKTLPLQIIIKNQYISENEIQNYFELADVILAPYQRHVGMSGILNRAAVAQKPVLSSDYGLMGEITYRYKLGLTVDSTKASAIAEGLTTFLTESPDQHCDRALMKQFAEQNTPQKFASTIFENILR